MTSERNALRCEFECFTYLFPPSRKLNIYNQPIGIRWNVPPRLSFRNIPTSRSSRTGPSMASNRIPCIHLSHFLCITYDHLVMNAMLHVICALLPLDITRTSHYILFYALFPSTTTVTESSHSVFSAFSPFFSCIHAFARHPQHNNAQSHILIISTFPFVSLSLRLSS